MAPISNIGDAGPSTSTSMTKQQHERPRFGLHQNPLNWTSGTGSTHNFGNDLKEQKLMNANLEVFLPRELFKLYLALLLKINFFFQSKNPALHAKVEKVELMAQGAVESLELKAENQAGKENAEAEQNANYQVCNHFFPAN
jgi:hypothetical protein